MFQLIVANISATLVSAMRSLARALKAAARSAKRIVDPVTGAVRWVYDRTLNLAHDGLDLAEHAAAVPGAAIGAMLPRPLPSPGDIADAATAADRAPAVAPARPRDRLAIQLNELARELPGGELHQGLDPRLAFWMMSLSVVERGHVANATPEQIRAHISGTVQIPGVPRIWTAAEVAHQEEASRAFDLKIRQDARSWPRWRKRRSGRGLWPAASIRSPSRAPRGAGRCRMWSRPQPSRCEAAGRNAVEGPGIPGPFFMRRANGPRHGSRRRCGR